MDDIDFPKELIAEFRSRGLEKNIKSHIYLINKGDWVKKVYLVLKGGLVVTYINPKNGDEKAINFFIPGFHALATICNAFLPGESSQYYLKTFTNTNVIEMDKSELDQLICMPEYANVFHQYSIRTLMEKNAMRTMLISLDSVEMLQYLKQKYPQLLNEVPSKYIANYLGITPQWLSKLKHEL